MNLLSKTYDFITMIDLLSKTDDLTQNDKFINYLIKQVLAGPDMSDFRLLVQFRMFRIQNLFFDKIYK